MGTQTPPPMPTGSDVPPAGAAPADAPLAITADMLETPPPESLRADFERGMSMLPVVIIALAVINVAIFAWQFVSGGLESAETFITAGALYRESVLDGEIWRLLTATYLHAGADHLLGNLFGLYVLGVAVPHAIGWQRTLLAYHVAGLTGSILSVIMSPGPGVGASGAIFGLAGLIIVFLYRHQQRFQLRDKRVGIVLLAWAAWTIATGFLMPGIDNFAHIGGFVGGAIMGMFLPARSRPDLETAGFAPMQVRSAGIR